MVKKKSIMNCFYSLILVLILNSGNAFAESDFEHNAKGLNLTDLRGRTLVGVTRDNSDIWSLFLSHSGKAQFHFSSGKRKTAKWRQRSSGIICFTEIVDENPSQEICKLATPLGRGTDWMTVEIEKANTLHLKWRFETLRLNRSKRLGLRITC